MHTGIELLHARKVGAKTLRARAGGFFPRCFASFVFEWLFRL
jgi:hypothetical protein